MPESNNLLVATWNPRAVLRYDAATLALTNTFAYLKLGDPLVQIVAAHPNDVPVKWKRFLDPESDK